MCTLSGGRNCHLLISFPSQEGFTLKEKNLLLLEQILSFEGKPQFGRDMSAHRSLTLGNLRLKSLALLSDYYKIIIYSRDNRSK